MRLPGHVTVALSFIIGLELHSYRRANDQDLGFGTTRTFTLIGVAGFVLYMLDEQRLIYLCGLIGLRDLRQAGESGRTLRLIK